MSKLYKGKIQNLMPQITLKQLKKEKTEIPHPKNNKLKIYKSVRPFGKDVTNIKQNYPMIPISSFNPNHISNKVRNFLIYIIYFLD